MNKSDMVAHKPEVPQYLLAAELRDRGYVIQIPLLNVSNKYDFYGPDPTIECGKAEINFLDRAVSLQVSFKLSFDHIRQIAAVIEKFCQVAP